MLPVFPIRCPGIEASSPRKPLQGHDGRSGGGTSWEQITPEEEGSGALPSPGSAKLLPLLNNY